jgi:predicted lipoprotein with Yx(FWY)xxD motif
MSKALLFVFVVLVLLASACSPKPADTITSEPTVAPATTEPTEAPATEVAAAATEAAVVPGKVDASADVASQGMTAKLTTLESDVLGAVLVDTNGKVLYVFKSDGQNSGKSTCSGECLWTWAPLTTTNAPEGAGLDASLLGTINRTTSGVVQVTYNGWPLYRYLPDSSIPGQINGQGVDGKWFAIAPDGSLVTEIPAPVAP